MRQAAEAVTLYFGQFCVPADTPTCSTAHTDEGYPEQGEALAEMRRLMRLRHYSPRTESSYLNWARRFLAYTKRSGSTRPTAEDVKSYLSHLAIARKVAASTQNQAFNALLFLFRNVFQIQLDDMNSVVRARSGRKLPVVLSPEETRAVLEAAVGIGRVMLELMYGGGLRVGELVQLRVMDPSLAVARNLNFDIASSDCLIDGTSDSTHGSLDSGPARRRQDYNGDSAMLEILLVLEVQICR